MVRQTYRIHLQQAGSASLFSRLPALHHFAPSHAMVSSRASPKPHSYHSSSDSKPRRSPKQRRQLLTTMMTKLSSCNCTEPHKKGFLRNKSKPWSKVQNSQAAVMFASHSKYLLTLMNKSATQSRHSPRSQRQQMQTR